MVKIIDEFNTEEGALIECVCGVKFYIYYGSEKSCSCGRTYIIKVKIMEVI